jgi:protein-S-isoprenylcysteine O-methyltransferase Ste14
LELEQTARRSEGTPWLIRTGQLFFKVRDGLFPLVFFGLAFASRPRMAGGSSSLDAALDALGIAVALAGQLLRALVIGFAYVRRGGKNKQIYADSLQQDGFFAHCRNPLYVGNFLALVGFCLIHNSLLCYLVGIPFFAFAYLAIVSAEEQYLARRFGSLYDEYCRRVPRFVPSFRGLGRTLAGMEFSWKRLVRKEYGSTYAGLCTVLVLIVWEHYVWEGFPGARGTMLVALGVWIPSTIGYLVARALKKSGSLGHDDRFIGLP